MKMNLIFNLQFSIFNPIFNFQFSIFNLQFSIFNLQFSIYNLIDPPLRLQICLSDMHKASPYDFWGIPTPPIIDARLSVQKPRMAVRQTVQL